MRERVRRWYTLPMLRSSIRCCSMLMFLFRETARQPEMSHQCLHWRILWVKSAIPKGCHPSFTCVTHARAYRLLASSYIFWRLCPVVHSIDFITPRRRDTQVPKPSMHRSWSYNKQRVQTLEGICGEPTIPRANYDLHPPSSNSQRYSSLKKLVALNEMYRIKCPSVLECVVRSASFICL